MRQSMGPIFVEYTTGQTAGFPLTLKVCAYHKSALIQTIGNIVKEIV